MFLGEMADDRSQVGNTENDPRAPDLKVTGVNLELLKAVMVQVLALSSLTDSGRPLNVKACYLGLLRRTVLHCHLLLGARTSPLVVSWQGSGGSPGTSFSLKCFPEEYSQALAFSACQVMVAPRQGLAD